MKLESTHRFSKTQLLGNIKSKNTLCEILCKLRPSVYIVLQKFMFRSRAANVDATVSFCQKMSVEK